LDILYITYRILINKILKLFLSDSRHILFLIEKVKLLIPSSRIECSPQDGFSNSGDNPYQNGFSNHNYIMHNMVLKSMQTTPFPAHIQLYT
jgi:hypothetical protein